MTNSAKWIEEKIKVAQRGKLSGKASGNARVPPGQKVVRNFPVLDLGLRPEVDATNWTLRVFGMVERKITLDWKKLTALAQVKAVSDFNCVTHWTQLDMDWQGVRARDVLSLARPLPDARYVTLH